MPRNESVKPVKKYRSGAISVAVWKQRGERGDFYNVTAQRAFKREGSETWEHNDSFGRDDVPTVSKLLDLAFTFILREEEKAAESKHNPEEP